MPDLDFRVIDMAPAEYAATPTLIARVGIDVASGESIRGLSLNAQVRLLSHRRSYSADEQRQLQDVFGQPEQWASSLKSLLWTNLTASIPPFEGSIEVDLHLPCTYDFDVVASRYLHALNGGVVPLELLFSGTVFYQMDGRLLQVERIAWDREARFDLPIAVWRRTIDAVFPNSAWLRVSRECFDALAQFRSRETLPTWEATLEKLLEQHSLESAAR